MKQIIAALLLGMAAQASALDINTCVDLYKKAAANPFQLNIGELDTIALCAKGQQAMMIEEKETERRDRAIERLYSRPGALRDAE